MGAAETVTYRGIDDTERDVLDVTGGELCDVVVEAVGAQHPLDLAGRLTRVRGRLVIAGFHQDGARTADIQLWNWRGIDVVNAHERSVATRRHGIEEAVEAISAGTIDPTPLYTHEYELDGLAAAMDAMVTRPDGFMKALVLT
jgi:threonine dehydrogenase-like Zn-dependent dehydrogenase